MDIFLLSSRPLKNDESSLMPYGIEQVWNMSLQWHHEWSVR